MNNSLLEEMAAFYAPHVAATTPATAPTAGASAPVTPVKPSPGSWQDLEARGVPFSSWASDAQDQFMADQLSPKFTAPVLPQTDVAALKADTMRNNGVAAPSPVNTWQDLEARGVPYELWPAHLQNQFVADQTSPPEAQPEPTVYSTAPSQNSIAAKGTINLPYDQVINELSMSIHQKNIDAGWWTDLTTGKTLLGKDETGRDRRNVGELLCLVHSEVSEAMEGYRKNLMDDKLPHRSMLEVELADVFIRIFDLAGSQNLDLGGAIREKLEYNQNREDHKITNRMGTNGKKF